VTLLELMAMSSRTSGTSRTSLRPLVVPFRYRIDALRVDGTQSADPADYAGYSANSIVGADLHAFVTAELARRLIPGDTEDSGSRVVSWPLLDAILLARAPTVDDLRRWSAVEWLVPDGLGSFRAT